MFHTQEVYYYTLYFNIYKIPIQHRLSVTNPTNTVISIKYFSG